MSGLIRRGAAAPEFSADASNGARYTLRAIRVESRVLLVFYPGNNTPG